MNTIIVSAFCGTGKTHLCNDFNINYIEFECWKYENDNFPTNYIEDIKSQIGKVDYIFISTNPVVLKELNKLGIEITLVYPKLKLRKEYLKRYEDRGSTNNFIKMIDDNWYDWLYELHEQSYCNHIELSSDEYLSNVLN